MSGSSPSNASTPYEATAEWYDAIYEARGRDCALEGSATPGALGELGTRGVIDSGSGSGAIASSGALAPALDEKEEGQIYL